MKTGELYAIDLHASYRGTHPALRGKHVVAWCDGPARDSLHWFAVADAIFDAKPTMASVRKRKLEVLVLTIDNPAGLAAIYKIYDDELPRGVSLLGTLPRLFRLTPKQKRQGDFGDWVNIAMDRNFQWRETHDAVALKRARAAEDAKERRASDAARKKRRAGGLEGIARRTLARELTGLISKARATAIRTILKAAITDLEEASPRRKKDILKATVKRLNAYDEKQGGFIETPEREALMVCLEDIAAASGLGEMTEELNEWRDW